ncbi:hypothetical protein FB561_1667 [Kribbella amoyensis]|uniref:Uncharacterized protein n=1 Tax=Kribbella amoyensis TaxID=996641 RepID=A0A561BNY8_9ACTN|nr:hypothetical protein FB561_1667 [Kribbella amoyensis]
MVLSAGLRAVRGAVGLGGFCSQGVLENWLSARIQRYVDKGICGSCGFT